MLGKMEGKRRKKWQKMRWLNSITDSMDTNLSKLWKIVKDRGAWHALFLPPQPTDAAPFVCRLPFPAPAYLSLQSRLFREVRAARFPCKSDSTHSMQRFQTPERPSAALLKPEPRALPSCGPRNGPPRWARPEGTCAEGGV